MTAPQTNPRPFGGGILIAAAILFLFGAGPASQPAGQAPALDPASLAERLNSPDFTVRQQATYALLDAGKGALPVMRRIMDGKPVPEVAMRIQLAAELLYTQLTLPPEEQHGFLGIHMNETQDMQSGEVEIAAVLPFLPAERAGLKAGDVVRAFNKQVLPRIAPSQDLQNRIYQTAPGEKIELTVKRGDREFTVALAPTTRPLCYSLPNQLPVTMDQFKAWYVREIDPTADAATLEPLSLTTDANEPSNVRNLGLRAGPGQVVIHNGQGGVIIHQIGVNGQAQGQIEMKMVVQGQGPAGGPDAKGQAPKGQIVVQQMKIQFQNVGPDANGRVGVAIKDGQVRIIGAGGPAGSQPASQPTSQREQ